MADFNCPACGADVPATGSAHQLATERMATMPIQHASRRASPECGAKLERKVDPPGDKWQLQEDAAD